MVYIYRTFESVPAATATCIHRQTCGRCPGKNRTTLNIYLESCLAINLEGYLGIYLERHLLGHML